MRGSQPVETIMNLAVNARDAMPGGGVVRIETSLAGPGRGPPRRAGVGPKGRCVMLAVSDNEWAIHRSHAAADRAVLHHKGDRPGDGAGLSMVQGIVMQSGGSIDVQSEPGVGDNPASLVSCPR